MEHRTQSDLDRADFVDPIKAMQLKPSDGAAASLIGHIVGAAYAAPTVTTTGYAEGAIFVDALAGNIYVNNGVPATPDWQQLAMMAVGTAAATGSLPQGSFYFETDTKILSINTGTKAAPVWETVIDIV